MPTLNGSVKFERQLAVLAAMLVTVVFAGCDRFYTVSGVVKRCDDQRPISGATVRVHLQNGKDGESRSAADGKFVVDFNERAGSMGATLQVSAPGFADAERAVHHSFAEDQGPCLQLAK